MRNNSHFVLAAILVIFTVLGFGNTLAVYFHCDDLLHLPYLYRIFHGEPDLLLANFYGPWINERSLYIFYRPITEISLALDYWLYESNAWGYHLSNLLLHASNGFLVWLLFRALLNAARVQASAPTERLAALFCALIFLCFPTHSEAVAWILARSDLIATLFYLLSLILFLKGRDKACKTSSLACFALALGAKEMAISLPLVIFLLAFVFSASPGSAPKPALKPALKASLPYLILVMLYVLVRYLALGTIVGGYIGSIGDMLNSTAIERWISSGSLWQLMHPFNEEIFAENHPLRLILRIIYGLAGLLLLFGRSGRLDLQTPAKLKVSKFALLFLLITLAPNWQVWGMSSTMSGGRIAYLPSIPLAMLITSAVFIFDTAKVNARALSIGILTALTVVLTIISRGNNEAWLRASATIKTIVADCNKELEHLPQGQKLALCYLPSRVAGAFTFTTRGMVAGLFKPPLAKMDRSDAIVALDFKPYWSPTIAYDDFYKIAGDDRYKLLYYESTLSHLIAPRLDQRTDGQSMSLSSLPVAGKQSTSYYLRPLRPVNPLNLRYLLLTVSVSRKIPETFLERLSSTTGRAPLFLSWNHQPGVQEDLNQPFCRLLEADGKPHNIVINLGTQKRWLLSHNIDELRIDLDSNHYQWNISKAELHAGPYMQPQLSISDNNYGTASLAAGTYLKGQGESRPTFTYTSAAPAGNRTLIEISKAYGAFEHYENLPAVTVPTSLSEIIPGTAGTFTIGVQSSPNNKETIASAYQIRAGLLDSKGSLLGAMSDPIVIFCPPPLTIEPGKGGRK